MKVKDLITALGKLNPESDVYGYCEDESLRTPHSPYSVFFIDGVDEQIAIITRKNGSPIVTFDNGVGSRKLAFVNMTTDF